MCENINHNSITQTCNSILDDYVKYSETKENIKKGYKSEIKDKIFILNTNENEELATVTKTSLKPVYTAGSCDESFINILDNLDGDKMKDRIKDKIQKVAKNNNAGDGYSTTADKTNSKTTNRSNKVVDEVHNIHNKPSFMNKEQLIIEYEKRIEELKSEENLDENYNTYNTFKFEKETQKTKNSDVRNTSKNRHTKSSNNNKNSNYNNNENNHNHNNQKVYEKERSPSNKQNNNNHHEMRTNSKDNKINSNEHLNKNKYGSIGLSLKNVFQLQKPSTVTKNIETKVEKREFEFLSKETQNIRRVTSQNKYNEDDTRKYNITGTVIKTTDNNAKQFILGTEEVIGGYLKNEHFGINTNTYDTNANIESKNNLDTKHMNSKPNHTKSYSNLNVNNIHTYNPSYTIFNSTKANNYNIINTLKDLLKHKDLPSSKSNHFHYLKKKKHKNEPSKGASSRKKEATSPDLLTNLRPSLINVLSGSHRPREEDNHNMNSPNNVNSHTNVYSPNHISHINTHKITNHLNSPNNIQNNIPNNNNPSSPSNIDNPIQINKIQKIQTTNLKQHRTASTGGFNIESILRVSSPSTTNLLNKLKLRQNESDKKKTSIISNFAKKSDSKPKNLKKSPEHYSSKNPIQSTMVRSGSSYSTRHKQETDHNDINQNLLTKLSSNDFGLANPILFSKNNKIDKISSIYNNKFSSPAYRTSSSPFNKKIKSSANLFNKNNNINNNFNNHNNNHNNNNNHNDVKQERDYRWDNVEQELNKFIASKSPKERLQSPKEKGFGLKSPTSMVDLQSAKLINKSKTNLIENYCKKEELRLNNLKSEVKIETNYTALSPRVNNFIKSSNIHQH